ncbi:Uncharacterized protein Adt_13769 [Abeliophyllum distichum]|uniref:Brf1 TBP-binding domain-containing protein n=1 Tax=Abeliophyllum distichum TaxID=126358 RepID=A0ABD1TXS4_9LAMI
MTSTPSSTNVLVAATSTFQPHLDCCEFATSTPSLASVFFDELGFPSHSNSKTLVYSAHIFFKLQRNLSTMAIMQNSSKPLEPLIVEVETSHRDGVASQSGMLRLRASGVGHQDFNKKTSGQGHRYKQRSRTKSDGSESLSDIDDAEVVGYLNNKKEMQLKRMLWEAMNKEHVKVKKQKVATETKKITSVQKAVKTTEKLKHQKRSSRINYDALSILNDDLERGSGTAHNIDLESHSWRNDDSQITYGDDDGIFGHHNDQLTYGYGDEYNEDDNFDIED